MYIIALSIGLAIIVAKEKNYCKLGQFLCKHETIDRKGTCHNENSKDSKSIYIYIYIYKLSDDFIKYN